MLRARLWETGSYSTKNRVKELIIMRIIAVTLCFVVIFLSANANAEIEKTGVPCKEGLCLFWWPKLAPVEGWHHERGPSNMYGINAQVPDGNTFSNAETVIYAKALYKPGDPDTKSLAEFIEKDKKEFLARDPNLVIAESAPITTGDGQHLRSLTFFPKDKGNWEQVAYGEEQDFYLVFTVSSRTNEGLRKALDSYRQFITKYTEKP
jgi:hypothetical protein